MNVRQVAELFHLEAAAGDRGMNREIRGAYCGDLLSDVMANAPAGALWLTVQGHQNTVAVALLREMAAIVLVNGRRPDEDTRAKADEEGIPVLMASQGAYELAGRLYESGIGKASE